jgi:diguanylate cyclase (GGDEF)-like protein
MAKSETMSLATKLMVPITLVSLLIMAGIDFFFIKGSQDLFEKYVETQSHDYVESFVIATAVSSSKANITRVTKSIGAYADIKDIFIINNQTQTVMTSNKSRYTGQTLDRLPSYYNLEEIQAAIKTGRQYYKSISNNQYLFAYPSRIFAEDRQSKIPITILLLTSPDSVKVFFERFRQDMIQRLIVIILIALVVFYFLLKMILLSPIKGIISALNRGKGSEEAALCDIKTGDELGILAETYNEMILERNIRRLELVAKNEQLEYLSNQDALTGISNRRYFDRVLQSEWQRAAREGTQLSVIMVDIDYFKLFNDRYGHLVGDDCLKIVATTLANSLKRPGDIISRFGGEEFVVILPNSNNNAWQLAESCRAEIEKLVLFDDADGEEVKITISLGLATMVADIEQEQKVLVEAADMALYQAKVAGRNTVIIYDVVDDEPQFKRGTEMEIELKEVN